MKASQAEILGASIPSIDDKFYDNWGSGESITGQ